MNMSMNMSSVGDLRSDDKKKWPPQPELSQVTHFQTDSSSKGIIVITPELYDIDIKEDKVAGGESEAEGGQWCAANPQDQKISRQHLKRILPPTSRSQ